MRAANDTMRYGPAGSARRMAGLALALGLHLLFFAVLMAQRSATVAQAGRADAGAIVWIAPPVSRAMMTTPAIAARRNVPPKTPALSMPQATAMRVITTEPAPSRPPADDVLSAKTRPAPVQGELSALDQRSVGAAIKATLAESAANPSRKGLMRVRELGRFEQFGADVQEASVPDCDKGDALKLDPPVIPGTRVALKGLLVLPHLAHAALTGRCR